MSSTLYEELDRRSKEVEESNDCTVKTWAVVAGISYDEAHDELSSWGRRRRRKVSMSKLLNPLLWDRKLTAQDVTEMWRDRGVKTVVTAAAKLDPDGTYIVFVRGHVLAVKGGEIHDWSKGRKLRVKKIVQINQPTNLTKEPKR